ncbi:hypothetical protein MRX96_002466 [Rhipicephalus microplus]
MNASATSDINAIPSEKDRAPIHRAVEGARITHSVFTVRGLRVHHLAVREARKSLTATQSQLTISAQRRLACSDIFISELPAIDTRDIRARLRGYMGAPKESPREAPHDGVSLPVTWPPMT